MLNREAMRVLDDSATTPTVLVPGDACSGSLRLTDGGPLVPTPGSVADGRVR